MPTNGFSIQPLKVKLEAGEQKATEWLSLGGFGTRANGDQEKWLAPLSWEVGAGKESSHFGGLHVASPRNKQLARLARNWD